jgi:hypothetical protein
MWKEWSPNKQLSKKKTMSYNQGVKKNTWIFVFFFFVVDLSENL